VPGGDLDHETLAPPAQWTEPGEIAGAAARPDPVEQLKASSEHDMPSLRIVIRPNCSLSVRGAVVFFASLATVTLGIASAFTVLGLWPILLIALGELLALGWALHESLQRRFQAEILTITEHEVTVESRDRLARRQVVFQRHWAQIRLTRPAVRLHPSRLTIESHGRACEVGGFLTEDERCGLALRLKRLIGRVNESPPLALGRR
jgi:uncharacterized membrane protein